jgi:hypothetical protein
VLELCVKYCALCLSYAQRHHPPVLNHNKGKWYKLYVITASFLHVVLAVSF